MADQIEAGSIAMFPLVFALLRSLVSGFHVRRNLFLENLTLRHQLVVLHRKVKSPTLRNSDRLFWATLSSIWPRWAEALVIVQPQTVVRWHQAGFRLFWRWRSRHRLGRTPKDRELIDLIRRMWQANPTWGSPRIRAELAKLGLQVSAATVRKYRPKGERGPPSQAETTALMARFERALASRRWRILQESQTRYDVRNIDPLRGQEFTVPKRPPQAGRIPPRRGDRDYPVYKWGAYWDAPDWRKLRRFEGFPSPDPARGGEAVAGSFDRNRLSDRKSTTWTGGR